MIETFPLLSLQLETLLLLQQRIRLLFALNLLPEVAVMLLSLSNESRLVFTVFVQLPLVLGFLRSSSSSSSSSSSRGLLLSRSIILQKNVRRVRRIATRHAE